MEAKTAELVAERAEIVQLMNTYGHAIDRLDWNLFRRLFSDDVVVDFGATLHWDGLDDWVRDFERMHAEFLWTQHIISTHVIHIEGDRATAASYGDIRNRRPDGPPAGVALGTRYDDELRRTNQGWRITRRSCQTIWRTDGG